MIILPPGSKLSFPHYTLITSVSVLLSLDMDHANHCCSTHMIPCGRLPLLKTIIHPSEVDTSTIPSPDPGHLNQLEDSQASAVSSGICSTSPAFGIQMPGYRKTTQAYTETIWRSFPTDCQPLASDH